jgi:hypothetical protein
MLAGTMPNKVPYITAALVCEKILQDKDNVLSAIRIVDTLYVSRPPGNMPPTVAVLSVLLMTKSGDLTGPSELGLTLRSPSGRSKRIAEKYSSILTGGVHGQNLALTFILEIKDDDFGLYWIDAEWNGQVLTSIPFNLVEGQPSEQPVQS